MAIFNEILSGRYNRALQKKYAIKGHAPVRQLGGEIMPVHSFFGGVEERALEEWYRFGMIIEVSAGVGQTGMRFRNPTNSNRLVVFEKIAVADDGVAGASRWDLQTQTTVSDLAGGLAVASNVAWDKRLNVGSILVASFSNGGTALSLVRASVFFPAAGGNWDFIIGDDQEVILSPGEAIQLFAGTNAKLGHGTFWWRERKFEPEELNLG